MQCRDGARRGIPRDLLQVQCDLAGDVVTDDEVDVRGIGEQPQYVVDVGVLEIEIDRLAVVLRSRRTQIAGVGCGHEQAE